MRPLPNDADLTQLKLQAYELQRAFKSSDSAVRERARSEVIEYLPHRAESAKLTLADAQCALARSYGFASWARLKAHVEWLRKSPEERLASSAQTVNPWGFMDLEDQRQRAEPKYVENRDALRAMLRQDPAIARMRLPTASTPDWTKPGRTLLHHAAWGNGLELSELLLASGADPNAKDAGGATPLAVALEFGYGREPLAERLASFGPEPDNLRVAAGLGRLERARALLADAGEPDSPAARGLWQHEFVPALAAGRQTLLDDAFSFAARSEQLAMMTWLCEQGASVNAMPTVGSPLHWAAFLDRGESVRFLLAHGADVTLRDVMNGGSALEWAHVFSFEAPDGAYATVIELLLEHDTPACLPVLCAYAPIERVARALSEAGADLAQRDFHGRTGLENAMLRGRTEIARLLRERGASA
jgi:ankyrin repeat protein